MVSGVSEEPDLLDRHASKISPDDPRLSLDRSRGRTLRKGPALAVAFSLVSAIALSLIFALVPAKSPPMPTEPEASSAPPVVIPEVIQAGAGRALSEQTHDGPAEHPPRPASYGGRGAMDARSQQRREQDLKAESAGVLFEMNTAGLAGPGRTDRSVPSQPGDAADVGHAVTVPTVPGAQDGPNLQGHKNAFLDQEAGTKTADENLNRVQRPRSPYQVQAGSIIPATLITGINSDLPGPVIGQVRENVYDTVSGNFLLIPQGSRLLATYDSMIAWGQERVLLCWNRLLFPNGNSLNLACMPAADLRGAAGLTDEVDEHWWRILKGASIASLLAATSQGVAGNTQGFNPTVPQVWARNTAEQVNNVGQQITQRSMNIQPTITIRPGFSVNVIVTKDLIIPPYATSP